MVRVSTLCRLPDSHLAPEPIAVKHYEACCSLTSSTGPTRANRLLIGLAFVLLSACSGDSGTGPPSTFENIAGTYSGSFVASDQGITLESVVTITIQQSSGSLSGTWSMEGIVSDIVNVGVVLPLWLGAEVSGNGTFTGTIASGPNPAVSFTTASEQCPEMSDTFSGSFNSSNNQITVDSRVHILDDTCLIMLILEAVVAFQQG